MLVVDVTGSPRETNVSRLIDVQDVVIVGPGFVGFDNLEIVHCGSISDDSHWSIFDEKTKHAGRAWASVDPDN